MNSQFDEDWLRQNFLPNRFRATKIGPQSYSMKASAEFGNLENLFEIADMLLADPMLVDMEPQETNNTVELTKVGVEVDERATMQLEVIKDEPEEDIFQKSGTIFGDKARNLSSFAVNAQKQGIINGGSIGSE